MELLLFLILASVVAIFLYLTGYLRSVLAFIIFSVSLLFFGLIFFLFIKAFTNNPAARFATITAISICVVLFVIGRYFGKKHDARLIEKAKKNQTDSPIK